ncbi:MAG: DsrE family protein [Nitrospinae bacterium]|nr:DsrE family protein [Nitrospinota bacterium]
MGEKTILVIIGSAPYAGSDAAWNALRLAATAREAGNKVRIFLINAGVDAGRKGIKPPENFFDLAAMLKEAALGGAEVKYCKTCIDRCGIGTGDMIEEIAAGSMKILHDWVMTSDKAVTF